MVKRCLPSGSVCKSNINGGALRCSDVRGTGITKTCIMRYTDGA